MNTINPNNTILFHDFKHHLMTGVEWIYNNRSWNIQMRNELMTIGAAQLDYYIGDLSVIQIKQEVWNYLSANKLAEKEPYTHWLEENKGYREIILSDNSRWTLRIVEKENYIHIHPSRQSLHTIRIKANTLKTIICYLALMRNFYWDDDLMNAIRQENLDLSPIKTGVSHCELEKVFELFKRNINEH